MAKRSIARKGDSTDHGGTIISGDPTYILYGQNVARVGDMVVCPRCKGTFPIVTGAPSVWSGQNLARHGDVTSCGAKLIASQSTATIDDGSGNSATIPAAASSVSTANTLASDEPHAIRFQAIDPKTEQPMPKTTYILTRENGAQHGGITDHEGYTGLIETTKAERIAVHFMFKSPNGDKIEREDLSA